MGLLSIDRKRFVLGRAGSASRNLLFITEKIPKKSFRGFVSRDSGEWLAGILTLWETASRGSSSELADIAKELFKRKDQQASLEVSVAENKHGKFAKIHIVPSSTKVRPVVICVPAAEQGKGWKLLASALSELLSLGSTQFDSDTICRSDGIREHMPMTFAEIVKGNNGRDSERGREALLSENQLISGIPVEISIKSTSNAFSWNSFIQKLQLAHSWVGSCCELKGRFVSRWEDQNLMVEVAVGEAVPGPSPVSDVVGIGVARIMDTTGIEREILNITQDPLAFKSKMGEMGGCLSTCGGIRVGTGFFVPNSVNIEAKHAEGKTPSGKEVDFILERVSVPKGAEVTSHMVDRVEGDLVRDEEEIEDEVCSESRVNDSFEFAKLEDEDEEGGEVPDSEVLDADTLNGNLLALGARLGVKGCPSGTPLSEVIKDLSQRMGTRKSQRRSAGVKPRHLRDSSLSDVI